MENQAQKKERIGVVGAGLVGSLLSIMLAKRGYHVDLIEKRSDMRKTSISGGRTIAMSISNRGWKALDRVGLKEEIRANTVPKSARVVHLRNGAYQTQAYGRNGQAIHTINRKTLNSKLLDMAEASGRVKMYFNTQCESINYDHVWIELSNNQTGKRIVKHYDRIIGADGIFSEVAKGMVGQQEMEYERFTPEYGYKELIISPNENNNWKLDHRVVHVWPQGHFNLIALPNKNKTFTCTLFLKFNGEISLNTLNNYEMICSFFHKYFPSISNLIPDYCQQFIENPVSKIFSLKCTPWHYKRKVMLIGDACHAIAPFFAMGMNVGFEDCSVFDDYMDQYNEDLDLVFEEFSKNRKIDTDAIADLSLNNFTSLGKSHDPNYHEKWMLNRKLWEKLNDEWMPLYPMIAFSDFPLSDVKQKSVVQSQIINKIFDNEKTSDMSDEWLNYIYRKYIKKELVTVPKFYKS